MQIRFHPATLDSEDKLRDDRIKEYILGIFDSKALNFAVTNPEALSDALATADGSLEFLIEGDLEIFGDWIYTEIPVTISRNGSTISIVTGLRKSISDHRVF